MRSGGVAPAGAATVAGRRAARPHEGSVGRRSSPTTRPPHDVVVLVVEDVVAEGADRGPPLARRRTGRRTDEAAQ
jgi:hypothetical protein